MSRRRRWDIDATVFPPLPPAYTTPTFLIILTVPILVVIIFILLTADNLTAVATPLSVLSAVAGYTFNSAVKLHSEIRDRTFKFLLSAQEDEKLRVHLAGLGSFYRDKGVVSEREAVAIYSNRGHEEQEKLTEGISYVGNFFEKIYIAARFGEINHKLLREYYRGILERYAACAEPFIRVMRNSPPLAGSPFKDLERPKVLEGVYSLKELWDR